MDSVVKAAILYLVLLALFRIVAGRRTLGEMTVFDLLVLLIVGDVVQEFLIGSDASLTGVVLVIGTLLLADVGLSILKSRFRTVAQWVEGVPTILCRQGELDREALRKARVREEDILASARQHQGIARLEDIGLATLETNGSISIVPRDRV